MKREKQAQADAEFCLGVMAANRRDFREAIKHFKTVIQLDPKCAEAYRELVACHWALGESDVAIMYLTRLSDLAPDDFKLHLGLADWYRGQRMLNEAEKELRRALSAKGGEKKNRFLARLRLAQVLSAKKETDKAAQAFREAINYGKQNRVGDKPVAEAYIQLANLYRQNKRIDDALKVALEAATWRPKIAGLQLFLSRCYQDKKDWGHAIDAAVRARTIAPDDGRIVLYLTELYLAKGAPDQAIDVLESFLKTHSTRDSVQLWIRLGDLYKAKKQLDKAAECYAKAAELAPDFPVPTLLLADVRETQKRYDDAIHVLERFIEKQGQSGEMLLTLAQLQRKAGRLDAAIHCVERALSIGPSAVAKSDKAKKQFKLDSLVMLAALYDDAGKKDKAEKTILQARKIDPDNASVNNFLGYFYAEQGKNLDEAEKLVKKALEKEPESAAYLDSLGWVYFKQATLLGRKGRIQDALKLLKKAAAEEDDPVIHEHLGDVYFSLGLIKEAKGAWEKALEAWKDRPNEPPGPDAVKKKLKDLNKLKL